MHFSVSKKGDFTLETPLKGVYISEGAVGACTCGDHKKMDQQALEDEATFSLILAQDCLDIKIKMMAKCTVTTKAEIYTCSQFDQILVHNLDEFLNENIVILETNSMQMSTFIFYKRMKGVSITFLQK